jgi:1-acyl-sn-glycerol-3-phosphate acyltransferase
VAVPTRRGIGVMITRLDYISRLLATGFLFLTFSVGGFIMANTIFPVVGIFSKTAELRRARVQGMIQFSFRGFVFLLGALRCIKVQTHHSEKLSQSRGRLIVANHPTLIDVVVLISRMPRAQCIIKREVWDHKFFGGVVRAAGYIRNDGDAENLLAQCKEVLARGENIVIFPEGTRTEPGKPPKFQRGFANIALLGQSDILLAAITCDPPTLTKGAPWYEIPARTAQVEVDVGDVIDIDRYLDGQPRPKAVRRLTRDLEQYFIERLEHG